MRLTYLVDLIVGARPNIMKVAPIYHALDRNDNFRIRLIHTGQHSSDNMSKTFFELLSLPAPDHILSGVSGSPSQQTASIMAFYDEILRGGKPDMCIVVGDVTSSLACAIVAVKEGIPLAHVEAGLRSHDRTMPEEINRIVIDSISDIFYTPSIDANENLLREGKSKVDIEMVGNVMIDSFEMLRSQIENMKAWEARGLIKKGYGVATFHRPANVDNPEVLKMIVNQLNLLSSDIPLVFPIHPRTESKLKTFGLENALYKNRIVVCDPLNFVEFMSLVVGCKLVITDSGGVQEETTYLGIPCLTVRENTERPITITDGTNQLVHIGDLARTATEASLSPHRLTKIPPLWDGMTAVRIVKHLESYLAKVRD
jgi:UDP-N-acetylglucosamine 2-epimerase (non-hydrolysing)